MTRDEHESAKPVGVSGADSRAGGPFDRRVRLFRLYDVFAPARFVSGLVSDDRAVGFALVNAGLVAFGLWCYFARVRSGHPAGRAFAWFWAALELANGIGTAPWWYQVVATSLGSQPLPCWSECQRISPSSFQRQRACDCVVVFLHASWRWSTHSTLSRPPCTVFPANDHDGGDRLGQLR